MLPSRPFLLLPPPSSRFGPPTHVRPIDLPDDVLLCIFERLSHARDIAAVRGVCLAWRTLVDHTETIWRSLVFELPRCARTAHHAETWYRKAADYGNSQAQVGCRHTFTKGKGSIAEDWAFSDFDLLACLRAFGQQFTPCLLLRRDMLQFMLALLYTYGYSGHQRGQFISDML